MIWHELVISLLAAFGLVCLGWLAFGYLLLPIGEGNTEIRATVPAEGAGDGVEQAVSGLLWLRRCGLWRGVILIEDRGLNEAGRALAQRLALRSGVELLPTETEK